MKKIKLIIGLLFFITDIQAQSLPIKSVAFQNRWKPTEYINCKDNKAQCSAQPVDTKTTQWYWEQVVEAGELTNFIRFYSVANTNLFLNIENGTVQVSEIGAGAHSAHWEQIEGYTEDKKTYYRLKNRWKGTYLNIEKGTLQCTYLTESFRSAQWYKITYIQVENLPTSSFVALQNRWKPTEYINCKDNKVQCSAQPLSTKTTQWYVEEVPRTNAIRLYTLSNTSLCLNIKNGTVQVSAKSYFDYGDWVLEEAETVEDQTYYRLKNYWEGTYLNIENGTLQCTAIHDDALSAQWAVVRDLKH